MQMVKRVIQEIRDMRRTCALDGEKYIPAELPVRLTQAQWNAFLADPYLPTIHNEEDIAKLTEKMVFLSHPIVIVEG